MKKLAVLPLCLGCAFAISTSYAIDLKQSKVTQVVNDVQIISAADQQQKAASVNDIFTMPDILRTGPASRGPSPCTVTRTSCSGSGVVLPNSSVLSTLAIRMAPW